MKLQKGLLNKWKINRQAKILASIFNNKHDDHIDYTFAMEQYKRYSNEYAEIAGHDTAHLFRWNNGKKLKTVAREIY